MSKDDSDASHQQKEPDSERKVTPLPEESVFDLEPIVIDPAQRLHSDEEVAEKLEKTEVEPNEPQEVDPTEEPKSSRAPVEEEKSEAKPLPEDSVYELEPFAFPGEPLHDTGEWDEMRKQTGQEDPSQPPLHPTSEPESETKDAPQPRKRAEDKHEREKRPKKPRLRDFGKKKSRDRKPPPPPGDPSDSSTPPPLPGSTDRQTPVDSPSPSSTMAESPEPRIMPVEDYRQKPEDERPTTPAPEEEQVHSTFSNVSRASFSQVSPGANAVSGGQQENLPEAHASQANAVSGGQQENLPEAHASQANAVSGGQQENLPEAHASQANAVSGGQQENLPEAHASQANAVSGGQQENLPEAHASPERARTHEAEKTPLEDDEMSRQTDNFEGRLGTDSIYEMEPIVLPQQKLHLDEPDVAEASLPDPDTESDMLEQYAELSKKYHAVARADPLVGTVLAEKYDIVDIIGVGAMAVVYKATQLATGRTVAIKTNRGSNSGEEKKRFLREIETHSQLSHRNIVGFIDRIDTAQGTFMVMENIRGISLAEVIQIHGPVSQEENIWDTLSQVCDALDHAHRKGIIHRDLKAGNVILSKQEDEEIVVKILDFGIAKQLDPDAQRLTMAGKSVGSPMYMSPEQCLGEELTAASDIYALGLLAFEMITGQYPYQKRSVLEVMRSHCDPNTKPEKLSELVPQVLGVDQLEQIVNKALETDPLDRFSSVLTVKECLDFWIDSARYDKTDRPIPDEILDKGAQERPARPILKKTAKLSREEQTALSRQADAQTADSSEAQEAPVEEATIETPPEQPETPLEVTEGAQPTESEKPAGDSVASTLKTLKETGDLPPMQAVRPLQTAPPGAETEEESQSAAPDFTKAKVPEQSLIEPKDPDEIPDNTVTDTIIETIEEPQELFECSYNQLFLIVALSITLGSTATQFVIQNHDYIQELLARLQQYF